LKNTEIQLENLVFFKLLSLSKIPLHIKKQVFQNKKVNFLILNREKADKLVNGNGKLEEIIVCSNEIAASTAQLVVASNVSKRHI
jgi:hypothetical protein